MGKDTRITRAPYRKRKSNAHLWIVGLLAVGLVALWGWSELNRPGRAIPGLETFADEGNQHVDPKTAITYKTNPPTSGPHWPVATRPGFYTEAQPDGALVHSLEHGIIVIYYDPEDTPADVVETLKQYASQYPGEWDGVVVTPRQQKEAVILTAWRHMLRQETFNKQVAEKFIDAFRGRGPENPVR